MKTFTVRLSDELGDRFALTAHLDKMPMNEIVTAAIESYVASRAADPEFQAKVREDVARILRELDEGGEPG